MGNIDISILDQNEQAIVLQGMYEDELDNADDLFETALDLVQQELPKIALDYQTIVANNIVELYN